MKMPAFGRLAVVGRGVSGQSALELAKSDPASHTALCAFDANSKNAPDFSDAAKLMSEFKPDTLLVSPGVPLAQDWIQNFLKNGGRLTSELAFAGSYLESEKVIGVTGSLGKSTVVTLLEYGARSFAADSFAGGNLGTPLAQYVLDLRRKNRPRAPWLILELSSYQLENLGDLTFDHSAITFFTANHLERYRNLEHYYQSKWKLVIRTQGTTVMNATSQELVDFAKNKEAQNLVWTNAHSCGLSQDELNSARILGIHNHDNIALAYSVAKAAGWPLAKVLPALLSFPGLEHRCEQIRVESAGGVEFVNDSKATAIASVLTAVNAVLNSHPGGSLHLLLGGRDKKLPWHELKELRSNPRVFPLFFGECAELAQAQSSLGGSTFKSLKPAVGRALELAKKGDTVLLSPGGSSLDEFKNFEERGAHFKNLIYSSYGKPKT